MIAQKVTFAFLNNVIVHGLGFVSLFFVARYMGPEALGIIAFAVAYLQLFGTFSDLGFGTAHIKRVSEGCDFGRCNGTYFAARAVLITCMSMIILITIFVPKLVHHGYFVSREHEIVLYVMLLSTIIGELSMTFIITFGARRETAKQNVPKLIEKVVVVCGKVIVAVCGLSVVFLAGANLIGAITALVCFILLFRSYPISRPNSKYLRSYATFAIPVMFVGVLSSIALNMDKVMVQFFWTTADVGYYSAAERITVVLSFATTASSTLLFPTISSYHAKNDISGIRKLSRKAERYLSMIFFPVMAFILIFAKSICSNLLGTEFAASATLLVILILVVVVNGITVPYSQQIGATNHMALAAKLGSMVLILDIILNIIFIPREFLGITLLGLGGAGAALSTLISTMVGALLFRFNAYKITGSKPNPRIILHMISSVFMAIILRFLALLVSNMHIHWLLIFGIVGCILYFLSLNTLGEFGKKDLTFFVYSLSPGRLRKYALGELKTRYISDSQ